jgi:hypothetical protein
MRLGFVIAMVFLVAVQVLAQTPAFQLKIEQVMTQRELQDTGISTLTLAQRRALDEWLNRYTMRMFKAHRQSKATYRAKLRDGTARQFSSSTTAKSGNKRNTHTRISMLIDLR